MVGFADFINTRPLVLIALVLFIGQALARELGGWVRQRMEGKSDEPAEASSDKGFILSGVLGLLALLIAFTFGLAVDRYETRRNLVTSEANAIGTAEMRVQLLDPPYGAQLAEMLRHYASTRLAYGLADEADKPLLARSSATQRNALQAEALLALRPVAATALGPFVGAAVNSVLDVGVERETMLAARVPPSVLVVLMVFTLLTAVVLGYALTGATARHRAATAILFALLTLAIMLILDLDRPRGGTIRIDQSPMSQLVASFPPAH